MSAIINPFCGGDHPRMCGEHHGLEHLLHAHRGSSPHVRGAQSVFAGTERREGIIPACAGSTSGRMLVWATVRDHPRMCGEHPVLFLPPFVGEGSSPHVRGARNSF